MTIHYVRVYKKEWERKSSQVERGYLEGFFVDIYCDLVGGHKKIAWFAFAVDAITYGAEKAIQLGINFIDEVPVEKTEGKKKSRRKNG